MSSRKLICVFLLFLPIAAFSQDIFVNTSVSKKNVLFEEYTGVRCGNCPRAHVKEAGYLAAFPDRFFAVNIHAGGFTSPYHEGDPWLNVDEGETLNKTFGILGYPTAVIGRHKFNRNYDTDEGKWTSYIEDSVMTQDAPVNIAAKGRIDCNTRKLSLRVQLFYTSHPGHDQYLHIVLTQDRILAGQCDYGPYNPEQTLADGNYVHMHVFRGSINEGGMNGDRITGETGVVIEKTIEYTLPASIKDIPISLPDLRVMAFITDDSLYEVQNVCEADLEWENAPEHVLWLCQTKGSPLFGCDPVAEVEFGVENVLGQDVETLTYKVSGPLGEQTYTHTFEPALKAGETGIVRLEKVFLSASNKEERIEITLTGVNNKEYSYEHGFEAVIPVTHSKVDVPSDLIVLDVCQDQKGEELTWVFREVNGDILYSDGPYENLAEKGCLSHYYEVRVEKGCYYFSANDAGGNGIRGKYGNGFISMRNWLGEEFYYNNGRFDNGFTVVLDARSAGSERFLEKPAFKLYPNPASEVVFVEAEPGSYTVSIYALSGVQVRAPQTFTGGGRTALPLNGLPHGLYIVELRGENSVAYQKLIVK